MDWDGLRDARRESRTEWMPLSRRPIHNDLTLGNFKRSESGLIRRAINAAGCGTLADAATRTVRRWQGCLQPARAGWIRLPRASPTLFGLVPLEVWLLVHWAPPGKNVGEPKLEFVRVPAVSSRIPASAPRRCAHLSEHCRRLPNQRGSRIGFAAAMPEARWLFLEKRPQVTRPGTAI